MASSCPACASSALASCAWLLRLSAEPVGRAAQGPYLYSADGKVYIVVQADGNLVLCVPHHPHALTCPCQTLPVAPKERPQQENLQTFECASEAIVHQRQLSTCLTRFPGQFPCLNYIRCVAGTTPPW